MRYVELDPLPALRPYVRCLWLLEDLAARGAGAPDTILPDGCVELVVHYGDRFLRHRAGALPVTQPRSVLVGQITSSIEIQPSGAVGMVGVRFEPGGAAAFFGVPMHVLRDETVELADLWGDAGRDVEARVHAAGTDRERVRVVQAALLERFGDPPRSGEVDVAVERILGSRGRTTVAALCRELSVGRRSLERRFAERVGVSPKVLCRLVRFQRIFEVLEAEAAAGPGAPSRWASVAVDCGYYDQAHLIREFRAFSGQSPARYFGAEHSISGLFTAP